MSEENYRDLGDAIGWFIIAAVVGSGLFEPDPEHVVVVAATLGIVKLVRYKLSS